MIEVLLAESKGFRSVVNKVMVQEKLKSLKMGSDESWISDANMSLNGQVDLIV